MWIRNFLRHQRRSAAIVTTALIAAAPCGAQQAIGVPISTRSTMVGTGWASSSVNAVIFRTNSIASHGNTQYTAYYDDSAHVVLARRTLGADKWEVRKTLFTNNVGDAHNAIALAVDGNGVLHVAWAEHSRALHYARAVRAGSLDMGDVQSMTGEHEARVTYPQFYTLRGGDLLFLYRDGQSGKGDVMLNRWDTRRGIWTAVAHPLISGEGERNAYMNTLAVDAKGGLHLSWVWRESPDVASNHDVLYAISADEGRTWKRTDGKKYELPITAKTAELAWPVPQGHELINQTTMAVDDAGHPMIATYWRPEGSDVPQFHLVWYDGAKWAANQIGTRTQSFRLSGGGTKRIPVSRPLVLAGRNKSVYMIFRDAEYGEGISVATSTGAQHSRWSVRTLLKMPVGQWEPTYDPVVWQTNKILYLFVQRVGQGDAESLEPMAAQPVSILEWRPR